MSTRSEFFRDALVVAVGICVAVVVMIVAALWLGSAFSWVSFARWMLAVALAMGLLEGIVLLRTLRARRVQHNQYRLYRPDRTAGCTAALLIAFVLTGLALCGGLLEWVIEFR